MRMHYRLRPRRTRWDWAWLVNRRWLPFHRLVPRGLHMWYKDMFTTIVDHDLTLPKIVGDAGCQGWTWCSFGGISLRPQLAALACRAWSHSAHASSAIAPSTSEGGLRHADQWAGQIKYSIACAFHISYEISLQHNVDSKLTITYYICMNCKIHIFYWW